MNKQIKELEEMLKEAESNHSLIYDKKFLKKYIDLCNNILGQDLMEDNLYYLNKLTSLRSTSVIDGTVCNEGLTCEDYDDHGFYK